MLQEGWQNERCQDLAVHVRGQALALLHSLQTEVMRQPVTRALLAKGQAVVVQVCWSLRHKAEPQGWQHDEQAMGLELSRPARAL